MECTYGSAGGGEGSVNFWEKNTSRLKLAEKYSSVFQKMKRTLLSGKGQQKNTSVTRFFHVNFNAFKRTVLSFWRTLIGFFFLISIFFLQKCTTLSSIAKTFLNVISMNNISIFEFSEFYQFTVISIDILIIFIRRILSFFFR